VNYYKLPLDFSRLFENNIKDLAKYSEEESIDQHIELLLTTSPGEHKYDPGFGCRIWELDFERVVSIHTWESDFVQFITDSLTKYEPRIHQVQPRVRFHDVRNQHEVTEAVSIRKRADIQIDATLVETGKRCCFYYSLYLGPLSTE